jgi:hypothetical protein
MFEPIAIAVASALGVIVIQRLAKIPAEIRRHDRLIRERNEDLARWIADDDRALTRELDQIDERCNTQNLFYSSERMKQRVSARQEVLRRYRDQKTAADRYVANVADEESWPHVLWRRARKRPMPELEAPSTLRRVIGRWKESEAFEGGWAMIDDQTDPTARINPPKADSILLHVP